MGIFNIWAILVAALVTMPIGFIWYNPKVFGTAWMNSIGVTDPEKMKEGANMGLIFGMSLFFAFLLSLALTPMVIHQMGIGSILQGLEVTKDSKIELVLDGQQIDWLNRFRTFKHGAFHGVFFGILIALPMIGTNALYEKRGFKYIAINAGYWIVNMAVMGGIICAWQ